MLGFACAPHKDGYGFLHKLSPPCSSPSTAFELASSRYTCVVCIYNSSFWFTRFKIPISYDLKWEETQKLQFFNFIFWDFTWDTSCSWRTSDRTFSIDNHHQVNLNHSLCETQIADFSSSYDWYHEKNRGGHSLKRRYDESTTNVIPLSRFVC